MISVAVIQPDLDFGADLEAVMMSAASTDTPTSRNLQGTAQTMGRHADEGRSPPLQIPSRREGCGTSQLDHGFKIPSRDAALAANFSSLLKGTPNIEAFSNTQPVFIY